MKKILALFIIILSLCTTMTVFAHPGRTDSNGGHTNHSTGEYHYHHGETEHQHPNGICPYDDIYNDFSKTSSPPSNFVILLGILLLVVLVYFIGSFYENYLSYKIDKYKKRSHIFCKICDVISRYSGFLAFVIFYLLIFSFAYLINWLF